MLKYNNRQGNPATFETLDEVRVSAPASAAPLRGMFSAPWIADPKLNDFPQGLVYVYRSPDLYGGETAARNNTSFIVFSDKRYETKEELLPISRSGTHRYYKRGHRNHMTEISEKDVVRRKLISAAAISFTTPSTKKAL